MLTSRSEADRIRQLADFFPVHNLRQRRIQHVKEVAPRNGHGRGRERNRMNLVFDADDTLWENNIYFERAFDDFCAFLDHSALTPRSGSRRVE